MTLVITGLFVGSLVIVIIIVLAIIVFLCSRYFQPAIVMICRLSVCLSSVTRVYCYKTTEVRFTRFSHKSFTFSTVSLTAKFERVPLIEGGSN